MLPRILSASFPHLLLPATICFPLSALKSRQHLKLRPPARHTSNMASRGLKSPQVQDPSTRPRCVPIFLASFTSLTTSSSRRFRPQDLDWTTGRSAGTLECRIPSRPPGVGRGEAVVGSALPVTVRESSALRGAQRCRAGWREPTCSKYVGTVLVLQRQCGGRAGAGTPTNQTFFPSLLFRLAKGWPPFYYDRSIRRWKDSRTVWTESLKCGGQGFGCQAQAPRSSPMSCRSIHHILSRPASS
ncbi:hypothetical protein B0H13DRAFT_1871997 [Mycena leptocephala]|nr:hypothetical protein B0H13DRAFT_1871997 [Mycena leptocephala]